MFRVWNIMISYLFCISIFGLRIYYTFVISVIAIVLCVIPLSLYADSLSSAQKAYIRGDYSEAIRICLSKINEGGGDEALYFAGLSFSKLGNYSKARDYFRGLLKKFENSRFHDKALIKLVDTYFLEGNMEKAKTLYKSILKEYPNLSYKPLVCLRLAQVSAKDGDWRSMHRYIDTIKHNYAGSAEDMLARRLERRGDFFTVQVGAFSSKSNAVRFSRSLSPAYPVYVVSEKEEDFTLYKVRVGKYKSKSQAEYIYGKLTEEGYPARIYP